MDGDNMGQEHMLDDMEDYDEEDLETLFKTEDALQAIDMFHKGIGRLVLGE